MSLSLICFLFALLSASPLAWAGPTKVGNGDDGGDLEGADRVTSGILVETQKEAAELLRSLQVQGVEGLGQLIPEVEKAELYLATQAPSPGALTTYESADDLREIAQAIGAKEPYVYARTFPEPHAPTRFFPKSLMLDRKSLIALHIHEALHRALPKEIRQKEKDVSQITLAITSEGASRDRVQQTLKKALVAAREEAARDFAAREFAQSDAAGAQDGSQDGSQLGGLSSHEASGALVYSSTTRSLEPQLSNPNLFSYTYRSYLLPDASKTLTPVKSMHSLRSFLYPFGRGSEALGLGIEFSYLTSSDGQGLDPSYLGPIGLSARMKVLTWRRFDVDAFSALRLHSVGGEELRSSPLGRDIFEFGLSFKRKEKWFIVENRLSLQQGSRASQKIGAITYDYEYGSILEAGIAAASRMPVFDKSSLEIGGQFQVILAESMRAKGGAFEVDTGRMRVVSAGPEVALNHDSLRLSVNGQFVIDSTKGVSLEQLGDLMGHGVGQGSLNAGLTLQF